MPTTTSRLLFSILFYILASLTACSDHHQSEADLVNTVFLSLKNEDYQRFNSLIPTEQQLIEFAEDSFKRLTDTAIADGNSNFKENTTYLEMENDLRNLKDKSSSQRIELRQLIERTGDTIVVLHAQLTEQQWANATLIDTRTETLSRFGMTQYFITIYFSVDSSIYAFSIESAIQIDNSFYIFLPLRWNGDVTEYYQQTYSK